MSPLFKMFKSSENLEQTGIVLEYGETERDGKKVPVSITIARAGGSNLKFEKTLEFKTKPYKRMIQTESLDKKVSEKIMREVYAETVVLGWQNVQDETGAFVEFSPENAVKLFEALPDLFSDIVNQSNRQALFREAEIEADAKN